MTKNKFFKISILSILLVITLSILSSASELTLEAFSDEERVEFIKELDLKYIDVPVENLDFCCFDVNSKGEYLLGFVDYEGGGFNTYSLGKVSVYNREGAFLYGYVFNTEGTIDAFWNGENISVLLHRENILITVDMNGSLLQAGTVANTEENKSYEKKKLGFKTKSIDGITYKAKTGNALVDNDENAFSGQYSILTKTDEFGQETVIYENFENEGFAGILFFVVVGTFLAVSGAVIIVFITSLKSKNKK